MIYALSYNDGYDSEFKTIIASNSIDVILSKVRELEKNEEISLEMFDSETFYEIEEPAPWHLYDDYGDNVIRCYKIEKVNFFFE